VAYCERNLFVPASDVDRRGTTADVAGNTLGCRLHYAALATAGPAAQAAYCPAAGASGGDLCGSWCDNYCHLSLLSCDTFASLDACQSACAVLASEGAPNAKTGDSVQCRVWHLGVASLDTVHCTHAVPSPTEACVGPAPAPDCATYCAEVTDHCAGPFEQYGSLAACQAYCAGAGGLSERPGHLGSAAEDTLGCRLRHAALAEAAPGDYCGSAGPSGGDACGSWCDTYCRLALRNCAGAPELYGSLDACTVACASFDATGEDNANGGDSVQCRIWHLGVAGIDAPAAAMHCPHAAEIASEFCVGAVPTPTCADLCAQVTATCAGAAAPFASEPACLAYCETFAALPPGSFQDTSGPTIGCRLHAAQVASYDPSACAAAGATGDGVCGSLCQNYCQLSEQICSEQPSAYPTSDDCQIACSLMPTDGAPDTYDGDSVQCRINHLVAAAADPPASQVTHCPHTSEGGGGVCVAP
jgi:hypothetical protein